MNKHSFLLLLFLSLFFAACGTETPTPEVKAPSILRDIVYCSPNGTDLKMDIYRPGGSAELAPAVVFIHSGNWTNGNKSSGAGFDDIPKLVQSGFLIASIEYRLSPKAKLPAQIEDAKCAVRYLRANAAQYGIDPDHIGAYGVRAGGHIAAMLGVTEAKHNFEGDGGYPEVSSQVQAVVIGSGIFDLEPIFSTVLKDFQDDVFGDLNKFPGGYPFSEFSPLRYVSQDDPPFLLFHGDKDPLVPLIQSQQFLQNLQGAQVEGDLIILQNGGSDFKPVDGEMNPTREELRAAIIEFLRLHLIP